MRGLWLLLLLALAGAGMHLYSSLRPTVSHPDDPRHGTGDDGVVMLAAEWCGYCRRLRADFDRAGVNYRVLDVDTGPGARAMEAVGSRTVPVTIVGQQVVHGYDTARLDRMLARLGYHVY